MPIVRVGRVEWKLRLWSVAGTSVLLAAFIALGMWQIERAHQKEQIISAREDAAKAPPTDLSHWLVSGKPLSALYLHHVRLRGEVMASKTILQDEQTRKGRVGYDVWVPLRLAAVRRTVLLNRGWIARRPGHRIPDSLPSMARKGPFVGVLRRLPRAGLNTNSEGCKPDGWPRVVLYPRHANLKCLFRAPLVRGIVSLDSGSPGSVGGPRMKVSGPGLSPMRHYGYALQWFAMGVAIIVIYLVLNIRRPRSAPERD